MEVIMKNTTFSTGAVIHPPPVTVSLLNDVQESILGDSDKQMPDVFSAT